LREEEDIFHLPFTWCTSGLLSSTKEEEEEEEKFIENRGRLLGIECARETSL